jgi:hypothetical protein
MGKHKAEYSSGTSAKFLLNTRPLIPGGRSFQKEGFFYDKERNNLLYEE